MSLSLIIIIFSFIVGAYSLAIAFNKLSPNNAADKSPEERLKIRKFHKSVGFLMMLIFALNLFKYFYLSA